MKKEQARPRVVPAPTDLADEALDRVGGGATRTPGSKGFNEVVANDTKGNE